VGRPLDAVGLSTQPADWEKFDRAVRDIYRFAEARRAEGDHPRALADGARIRSADGRVPD
jgi:hypothetical protein